MVVTPMELLQDAIVTLVAVGAAGVLVRRLVAFAKPRRSGEIACSSCPSSTSSSTRRPSTPAHAPETHPVVFVRPRPH